MLITNRSLTTNSNAHSLFIVGTRYAFDNPTSFSRPPVYARSGDRMAEIVECGKGEKLAFSNRRPGSRQNARGCIDCIDRRAEGNSLWRGEKDSPYHTSLCARILAIRAESFPRGGQVVDSL